MLTRVYIGVDQGSVNYSPPAISSLFPVFVNKVYKAVFTQFIFLLLYNKLPQMQQLNANVLCHSFYSLGVQIQFMCVLSSCFHQAEIKVSPAAAILICHSSKLTLVVSRIHFLVTITGSPVFLLLLTRNCSQLLANAQISLLRGPCRQFTRWMCPFPPGQQECVSLTELSFKGSSD